MLGGGSMDEMVLLPLNFARMIFNIRSDQLNPMIMVKSVAGVPNQEMIDELGSYSGLREGCLLQPMTILPLTRQAP
jgi:hypothetical protein